MFLPRLLHTAIAALLLQALPASTQAAAREKAARGVARLQPIAQTDRIQAGDLAGQRIRLAGHVPAWVNTSSLLPEKVDELTTLHLNVVLRRAPQVQAAFEQLLQDQQDPASDLYHQWLTPAQVGSLYGPTQNDVQTIANWLGAQNLHVDAVAPSRMILQVSGAVNAVSQCFGVNFNNYELKGRARLSADSNPSIPAAISSVVLAVDGLTEVPLEPAAHSQLAASPSKQAADAHEPQPAVHVGSSNFILPNDFAVIYDIGSVYTGGNTGAAIGSKAQHIAVIDRSDVASADVASFTASAGISKYTLNTVLATSADPGQTANGDQLESTLDVDRTIGTAPGAVTDLVVAPNSTGGIFAAASYNVNTLMDPVMTISYYGCEANAGSSGVSAWDTLFSTAASEGISTFVCSGDSAAAGCASDFSNPPSTTPVRSVNYICSSTYATCVGGTEFNDTTNTSAYWSTTNGTGGQNALSYIPEGAWNDPTSTSTTSGFEIAGTGGGASIYMTKPTWQTGTGVPADGQRDQPDIAFTSSGHDGYYGCLSYSGKPCSAGYYYYLFGTSAAAPSMAGITALLNTRAGAAQGNLNPMLYKLAASTPAAFHDVTVASSGVTSCSLTVPSMCNNSTPGPSSLTGGLAGYAVTAGYDQSTGLGSLDVANFLAAAAPVTTMIAVAPSATSVGVGQSVTLQATLMPAASSVAAPSGTVQFSVGGTNLGTPVTLAGNMASTTFTPSALGTYTITAKYSGDSYFVASSSGTTVNAVPPALGVAAGSPSLAFTSGASSGNSNKINVASLDGFAGTANLTCSITTSTAAFQPTCSVSPTSVALTSGSTGTATVTIASTTATTSLERPLFFSPASTTLAAFGAGALLLFGLHSRRKGIAGLALMVLLLLGSAGVVGCSGGGGGSSTPAPTRSSAGSYMVTVTATGTSSGASASTTASATFALTIQ